MENPPGLSWSEERLLLRLGAESKVSPDDVSDALGDARRLVQLGHARLAAVVYPWGLELEFEITETGRALLQGMSEALSAEIGIRTGT